MKPTALFLKNRSRVIFSHIAAASENHAIGLKDRLPWHIPEDLKFFHNKTKGKALIMGRKTFESLGKPLSQRLNVVVTRQKNFQPKINTGYIELGLPGENLRATNYSEIVKKALSVVICSSIKDAMDFCCREEVLERHGSEIFITGGGEIYKETLPLVYRIYLTRIHQIFKGDAFYPKIPKEFFREIYRKDVTDVPVPYSFLTYERKA